MEKEAPADASPPSTETSPSTTAASSSTDPSTSSAVSPSPIPKGPSETSSNRNRRSGKTPRSSQAKNPRVSSAKPSSVATPSSPTSPSLVDKNTMFMFLMRALKGILSECPRKLKDLRGLCEKSISLVQKHKLLLSSSEEEIRSSPQISKLTAQLLLPLRQACSSEQPKLMMRSLDCLQKLVLYGFIHGDARVPDPTNNGEKLIDQVIAIVGGCFQFPDPDVRMQVLKALLPAVTSPICDVHDRSLMHAIKTCYNVYLLSEGDSERVAKATLTQMLNSIFLNMEREGKSLSKKIDASQSVTRASMRRFHIAFTDCFLIFRALCLLSSRDIPEGASVLLFNKSKVLSLELLATILESVGGYLRTNEVFVTRAVKKYLCPSIALNGVSSDPKVFRHSLNIFLILMGYFRQHLKGEIEIYFGKMFLEILDSRHSTSQQKWMVLKALYKICSNPQLVVDIFVNYDCDLKTTDIFAQMVSSISGIAKEGRAGSGDSSASQPKMNKLGLECLVTIMRSLVQWSKPLHTVDNNKEISEGSEDDPTNPDSTGIRKDKEKGTPRALSEFERIKRTKQKRQNAYKLFAVSHKKGFRFLFDNDMLENNPQAIAMFLYENNDELDKEQIGEYFGKLGEFTDKVLEVFISQFNFAGMPIDLALRHLLYSFRLPGEGEQVDRIMERFAAQYVVQEPDSVFATADAAYILAYSIIMLATDAHSPAIVDKMSLESWKRNHKGINDGDDLPDDMQDEIYARITATPLSLNRVGGTASASDPGVAVLDPKQRELQWIWEGKEMAKRVQNLLKDRLSQTETYYKSTEVAHVRPMFSNTWMSMLAAFSVLLETSDDSEMVQLSLEGIKCAVRVSSIFYMKRVRNTFVRQLAQSTHLSRLSASTSAIKPKNLESIRALIELAHEDGNFLQDSWVDVLDCISNLDAMIVRGSLGASSTGSMDGTESRGGSRRAASSTSLSPYGNSMVAGNQRSSLGPRSSSGLKDHSPRRSGGVGGGGGGGGGGAHAGASMRDRMEGYNAETIAGSVDAVEIDKLFTNSAALSSNAIVDFVRALCDVSSKEIGLSPPRMFSLKKLVEIAYYNMSRIRIVWSRIWAIMGKHLFTVGCHEDSTIAVYAVDSLKQLAMRFLEKRELARFNFQKDFLRPFEEIMAGNATSDIRDMIIQCLKNMIMARAENIKSGWKSIFVAFTIAAAGTNEDIVCLAFEAVEMIMKKYFSLIADDFFVECVNCLIAYGKNTLFKDISVKAIQSIVYCANQLAEGHVPLIAGGAEETEAKEGEDQGGGEENGVSLDGESIDVVKEAGETEKADETPTLERDATIQHMTEGKPTFTTDETHIRLWWPVLTGLSDITSHQHIDVRTRALEQLFSVCKTHGGAFTPELWDLIYRGVFLPIFVGVQTIANEEHLADTKFDQEWVRTTCLNAAQSLVGLFTHFFDSIASFTLQPILTLLASFVLQSNVYLAEIGCTCMLMLVMKNGRRLTSTMWDEVILALTFAVKHNTPVELFRASLMKQLKSATRSRGSERSAMGRKRTRTSQRSSASQRTKTAAELKAEADVPLSSGPPTPATSSRSVVVDSGAGVAPPTHGEQTSQSSSDEKNDSKDGSLREKKAISKHHQDEAEEEQDDTIVFEQLALHMDPKKDEEDANPRLKELYHKLVKFQSLREGAEEFALLDLVAGKCAMHLSLIQAITEIFFEHKEMLDRRHISGLLECLYNAYRFGVTANNSPALRTALGPTNIMKNIIRIEICSVSNYSRMLLDMFTGGNETLIEQSEDRLIRVAHDILEDFANTALHSTSSYTKAKCTVVVPLLRGLDSFDSDQWAAHIPDLQSLLVALIMADHADVRRALQPLFTKFSPVGSRN